ncbi:metal tolerance protein 4 [Selaginella moellendorffii]|uniref:metal tolerance protein 4 n=1 Tax=Selaginella moellendorffii TaxID=88036 RepID=UPI000D1CCBE7|nr:metal tolerance protein 4 [Selaginella moellendorffii]|eukprot:XP_002972024.2 metal tolerance protein 4 [Selaginella moellendorffii]
MDQPSRRRSSGVIVDESAGQQQQQRQQRHRRRESMSMLRRISGKWQFKCHKMLQEGAFLDTEAPISEGVREYNKRQREALEMFEEVDSLLHVSKSTKSTESIDGTLHSNESFAINISNISNVILLIMKLYATIQTQSLAIAASTLDSLLDLVAGLILWFTQWSMQSTDVYNYPIGKLRVQPVGIIIFAAVMATVGLQIFLEGVKQLFEKSEENQLSQSQWVWLLVIMGTATLVKLALFFYCRAFDNEIIRAYAMDHYFDVVTNLVGLIAAVLADKFYWWLDPVGAIILAVYTIVNWSETVIENAVSLIGKAAPPEIQQKLTYITFNHHRDIKHIDTVRAYTFGALYFVEVGIELPESMPLRDAHEIGQTLQQKFEALPEVERAFVQLEHDYRQRSQHQRGLIIVDR